MVSLRVGPENECWLCHRSEDLDEGDSGDRYSSTSCSRCGASVPLVTAKKTGPKLGPAVERGIIPGPGDIVKIFGEEKEKRILEWNQANNHDIRYNITNCYEDGTLGIDVGEGSEWISINRIEEIVEEGEKE